MPKGETSGVGLSSKNKELADKSCGDSFSDVGCRLRAWLIFKASSPNEGQATVALIRVRSRFGADFSQHWEGAAELASLGLLDPYQRGSSKRERGETLRMRAS